MSVATVCFGNPAVEEFIKRRSDNTTGPVLRDQQSGYAKSGPSDGGGRSGFFTHH